MLHLQNKIMNFILTLHMFAITELSVFRHKKFLELSLYILELSDNNHRVFLFKDLCYSLHRDLALDNY